VVHIAPGPGLMMPCALVVHEQTASPFGPNTL